MTELMLELQLERERRATLELELDTLKKRVEGGSNSVAEYHDHLQSEMNFVVSSRQMIRCGPDTVEHFENFSMSSVIAELQASCPEVYSLVQRLGSTQRNARDGALPGEELKAVMAICTLLNARSVRVKGVQLMISLMLVARGTGKQVYINHVY